jgi:hypothetical protein
MIRAIEKINRNVQEELLMPSPARIRVLTEEIQSTWSAAKRARRAGQSRRISIMMIRALDLEAATNCATRPE